MTLLTSREYVRALFWLVLQYIIEEVLCGSLAGVHRDVVSNVPVCTWLIMLVLKFVVT
jgi:hypothetical protein